MHMQWGPYPMARALLFFAGGITAYLMLGASGTGLLPAAGVLALGFAALKYFERRRDTRLAAGAFALPLLLLLGYLHTWYRVDSSRQNELTTQRPEISAYEVVIDSDPRESDDWYNARGWVGAVKVKDRWQPASGRIALYLAKEDSVKSLMYGDVLMVREAPGIIAAPYNPGEFDYRSMMASRYIHHQDFLHKDRFRVIGHQPPSRVMALSYQLRHYLREVLTTYVPGDRERAVVEALVIGVRDDLDDEVERAYAAAGAMHVLAVSGLHVGILYGLVLFVLGPLGKLRRYKPIACGLGLSVLWVYAFVTGFSPSVLRAVTMFSFFVLAKFWARDANAFNVLAASALCLLLAEPMLILSVGFQLSYLAVFGILWVYPALYGRWRPPGWLGDRVWQLVCVSLAAQLGTFPLALYYFHQFPVYFLISNLLVLPAAFAILSMGLTLVLIHPFAVVAAFIGKLLSLITALLNSWIHFVEELPGSVVDNIYIDGFRFWLLEGFLVALALLLFYRRFRYVIIASLCLLSFATRSWIGFLSAMKPSLAVYRIPGHTAFDILAHGGCYQYCDPAVNERAIAYSIRPNRSLRGVGAVSGLSGQKFCLERDGGRLILAYGISILHLTRWGMGIDSNAGTIDYLIVSNNSVKNLEQISGMRFKTIIFDSSNSHGLVDRLMDEARRKSLPAYSVLDDGAFVTSI